MQADDRQKKKGREDCAGNFFFLGDWIFLFLDGEYIGGVIIGMEWGYLFIISRKLTKRQKELN